MTNNAENGAPFCKGSMRAPKRTTDVNGATWGVCRACGRYEPLSLAGSVKPHRTRPTSSSQTVAPSALSEGLSKRASHAWDEAIREAFELGWLHDAARDDMVERNPYR